MPSTDPPPWREKATGFFSTSGVKIKQAGQSVGDVAKDAGENVAEAAERVGSMIKNRWSSFRESRQRRVPPSSETVPERLISAVATTGLFFKKGIFETKEKVVVGKMKVEEAAKKTAGKSKAILSNIERWQKGVASNDVFGVPIEVTVQRQHSVRLIPQILVKCADYLIISGLHSEYLFKFDGDRKVIGQLISLFNQDRNANLPDGVNPVDVAGLVKYYLATLPEPLTTFAIYREIVDARSSIHDIRNVLRKLPNVSYTTLEFITALLLQVSQKSSVNKMEPRSLALELAPLIIWQKDDLQRGFRDNLNYKLEVPSKATDIASNSRALESLLEEDEFVDASSQIPLDDDGSSPDYGAVEVIQCLIDHHNVIFTDTDETVWR